MSFYRNTKDKTQILNQSFAVYKLTCPGWSCSYIGKTGWTLHERTEEHAYPNRRAKNKVQFVNICQLGLTIVT